MREITNDLEAFEFVKDHLLSQNERCEDLEGNCQYRGVSSLISEEYWELNKHNFEDEYDFNVQVKDIFKNSTAMISCAVGCLIKNEFYDSTLEGKPVTFSSIVSNAVIKSNPNWDVTDSSILMLVELQSIHDSSDVENWEIMLEDMSKKFNQNKQYDFSDTSLAVIAQLKGN